MLLHRVLFVAWQNPTTRSIHPVARLLRLADEALPYEFTYVQGARVAAASGFLPLPGLSELDHVYRTADLLPLFKNRLMPKSRPDRADFLEALGFGPDEVDAIPILARSEGRKATDTIEVFGLPSFDEMRRTYRFCFFLRGVRYVEGAEACIGKLRAGDQLDLVSDAGNAVDPLAIRVHGGAGERIGYVPNTLVEDVHALSTGGSPIAVFVQRVNPDPAPSQLRLLCRLEARDLSGYVPFSTERYQPIPAGATRIDMRPEELVG